MLNFYLSFFKGVSYIIMKKYLNTLKKCALFQQIETEDLMTLMGCLKAKSAFFDKKEIILAEGSPAKQLGILLSGSAQLVQLDYLGNRSILSKVEPAQLFAESFACAEISSLPVSVIATEPCEVLLIDCHRILHSCTQVCDFHQQMLFNLMKDIATKNLLFHQKIEITSKRSTREKLLTYLGIQAKKHQSNCFEIPFDRQELADYLEVERSGLSTEIGKLQREGILKSKKHTFELLAVDNAPS